MPSGGGRCLAREFLDGLPAPARAQFRSSMDRLLTHGFTDEQRFRLLRVPGYPPVYELKIHHGPGYRLYCVQHHDDWFATHGDKKPKDSQVASAVNKARAIYEGRAMR